MSKVAVIKYLRYARDGSHRNPKGFDIEIEVDIVCTQNS
jgi:hypothetical protein